MHDYKGSNVYRSREQGKAVGVRRADFGISTSKPRTTDLPKVSIKIDQSTLKHYGH